MAQERGGAAKAEVPIDPDFAAVVEPGSYHVFLTEHGDHHGLTVKERGPAGFCVEADETIVKAKGREPAQINTTFSWRVVAKRKDAVGTRLERVEVPTPPVLPAIENAAAIKNEAGSSRGPSRP